MSLAVHMGSDYVQFGPFDSRKAYLRENEGDPAFYLVAGETIHAFKSSIKDTFGNTYDALFWNYKVAGYQVVGQKLSRGQQPALPNNTAVPVSY